MIIIDQLLWFYTSLYLRMQYFVSKVLFIANLAIFLQLMILSYNLRGIVTELCIVLSQLTDT